MKKIMIMIMKIIMMMKINKNNKKMINKQIIEYLNILFIYI